MRILDKVLGRSRGGAKLPTGDTIDEWAKAVAAERGDGYVGLVRALVAHYSGQGKADTETALRRTFPKTFGRMVPVTLPVLRKLVNERAQTFGGEGESFEWLTDDSDEADETFAAAVEAAGLRAFLKALDRRVEFCRRAFVRVTWDDRDERVKLTLFTPDRVLPRWPAGTRDPDACTGIVFEVEPVVDDKGKAVRRWEFWSPEAAVIVDDKGGIDGGETDGANPYRYDDEHPCVPVVSFASESEEVAGYWQHPAEDWLDTQRAINTDETSRQHLAKIAGYGQPVSRRESQDAQEWPAQIPMGPDELLEPPAGRTFENVRMEADLAGLAQASREHLNRVTSLNDLPPGSVLAESRTVPSGTALLLERAPLTEAREDRVDAYRVPLARLAEVIRVVHNHHAAEKIPEGALRWTPGDVTPPPDPESRARTDETYMRIGTLSPVRVLMRDQGLSRDDAIRVVSEIEEEKRLVAQRPGAQGNPFAAPPPPPLAGTSLDPEG